MESSESTPPSISPPQHTYQLQVPAGLPEEITAYYKLHQPLCGSLQSATILRASHPLSVVYVRVPKLNEKISLAALQKIRTLLPEGFPLDVFPLIPQIKYENITIKAGMTIHVAISQVPFNISLSGTLYKFQSLKYDWILLDELRKGEHPYVPPHESLYVATSRATHLEHLFLTKPLTDDDFAYFKPSPSVLIELARLNDIAIETKKRLCAFLFGSASHSCVETKPKYETADTVGSGSEAP